jgi:hypothetical protein
MDDQREAAVRADGTCRPRVYGSHKKNWHDVIEAFSTHSAS